MISHEQKFGRRQIRSAGHYCDNLLDLPDQCQQITNGFIAPNLLHSSASERIRAAFRFKHGKVRIEC